MMKSEMKGMNLKIHTAVQHAGGILITQMLNKQMPYAQVTYMNRHRYQQDISGGCGTCRRGQGDALPQAALHLRLLKGMAAGAGAGFLAALLFLAAAEGLGIAFTHFTSGLIAFGVSGWCGVGVYLARLLRIFLSD